MNEDLISVIDLAKKHGKMKQGIFKILKRLGIESRKMRGSNNRGQVVAYLTVDEAQRVEEYFASHVSSDGESDESPASERLLYEYGVFYLLELEPEHDPGRFKVGLAVSLHERLRQHRCAAPFATIVASWPCKRLWEKTAIDSITEGCLRIHTEVFRTDDITKVVAKCDHFFSVMPSLDGKHGADQLDL